ncbi:MAG: 2-oxoglutarate dehydrogenase E1 component [Phycisphaerae bacterium]|jgi:2-oxoglutarate dehydrogenase E1 component
MHDSDILPNHPNLAFVEQLYADYVRDPASVPDEWKRYFARLPAAADSVRLRPSFEPASIFHAPRNGRNGRSGQNGGPLAHDIEVEARQDRVDQLIRSYRVRGHRIAELDPLGLPRGLHPELEPAYHGFTDADLDRLFSSRTIPGKSVRTLREILAVLRNTYCRYIGVQFMHIDDLEMRSWLQQRMEASENRLQLSRREQLRILTRLTDAVIFEEFIQKKYVGAKSFSLEGAETLIPLLDLAIERAGEMGIDEIVLGMAHRGRLNVLANILGKSPRSIFREFADVDAELHFGRGDVKYHKGYHADWVTASGHSVHLALCFNPSHLEFVGPVALGRLRAKQDRLGDLDRTRGLAILIHGDAAFTGEGVVQETLNLSQLPAYRVGGSLHIIVNNQIGFTTGPEQGRSSLYASAIGKMLQSPIFHVNGEDPESVAQVVKLAMEFRREFQRDVIIEMFCFRRRGHNEGDEPSFTQPVMYNAIRRRKSVRESYLDHLVRLGGVSREQADEIADRLRERLESELSAASAPADQEEPPARPSILGRVWSRYRGGADASVPEVDTAVDRERLSALLERLATPPEDFHVHPKLVRFLEARRQMARGERPLDWAAAEALALASLAVEGTRVRMTGQDCERGTFSQRHLVLHDAQTGRAYPVLQNLSEHQAPAEIVNSPLSEAGVMGYEYGYSIAYPDALVLWEAQFGDFANCAQAIIDQFITCAEDKWGSFSGLTLLLPHGFEGQGPEHSSARLERFLQLAAEDNIQVCYPSTPAQYFHMLRRQVVRPIRKPLVVMTPKSLLRHPEAVSSLDELACGRFRRILPDVSVEPSRCKRVLLCSGKIYYDLAAKRQELGRDDIAIVRVEQLYPLPDELLEEALRCYPDGTRMIWVQEEPENMGAWYYLRVRFGDTLFRRWPFCAIFRVASASPATGSHASHQMEQTRLVHMAFGMGSRLPRATDHYCSGHPTCCSECTI